MACFGVVVSVVGANVDPANTRLPEPDLVQSTAVVTINPAKRPWGIAFGSGNMYVAGNNFDIDRISPAGQITAFSKIPPDFVGPGMVFDAKKNLVIADGKSLFSIDPKGKLTTLMTGFARALDLQIDRHGNVLVADDIEGRVYRLDAGLNKRALVDRHLAPMWFALTSITLDPTKENLFVAESVSGKIFRYPLSREGTPGSPELIAENIVGLRFLAADGSGNVYANTHFPIVIRIDRAKKQRRFLVTNIEDPAGMAFGQQGFDPLALYITHRHGVAKVRLLDGPGILAATRPNDEPRPRLTAELSPAVDVLLPCRTSESGFGVTFNPRGQLFMACLDSYIRTVPPTNASQLIKHSATRVDFRSGGSGYMGRGMACDQNGNLYATDGTTVFRVDSRGMVTRFAGGFQDVIDLKIDAGGNLFVAEARQCAVDRITPQLTKTRVVSRGYRHQMREMLAGLALDPTGKLLYVAERYSGSILRYELCPEGQVSGPEIIARDIVSLRSIAVDHNKNVYASVDFPILLRFAPDKQQTKLIIPNCSDFCVGRIALGVLGQDKDTLYVPIKDGIVRIRNASGI